MLNSRFANVPCLLSLCIGFSIFRLVKTPFTAVLAVVLYAVQLISVELASTLNVLFLTISIVVSSCFSDFLQEIIKRELISKQSVIFFISIGFI